MKDIQLTVGVEIETSNMTYKQADTFLPSNWSYHGDGSIPGGGVEFVSNKMPEAEIHKIPVMIDLIKAQGGTFPDSHPAPTCLKDCQIMHEVPEAFEKWKKAKATGEYVDYYKDELNDRRREAREMWARAKRGELTLEDDLKQECCGFHVHVGIKSKRVRTNGKLKGIAQAVYAFYYDQDISPNLPLCRLKGGLAYGWCQLIVPELTAKLHLEDTFIRDSEDDDYALGSRYQAVNICSEFCTIEFRQGSISDTCRFAAHHWARICCDIVRGSWQLTRHKDSPNTVAELYAMLPPTLDAFRAQVDKIRANPDKYLLKRPKKPKKAKDTVPGFLDFTEIRCDWGSSPVYVVNSQVIAYIEQLQTIRVDYLQNSLQLVNTSATTR